MHDTRRTPSIHSFMCVVCTHFRLRFDFPIHRNFVESLDDYIIPRNRKKPRIPYYSSSTRERNISIAHSSSSRNESPKVKKKTFFQYTNSHRRSVLLLPWVYRKGIQFSLPHFSLLYSNIIHTHTANTNTDVKKRNRIFGKFLLSDTSFRRSVGRYIQWRPHGVFNALCFYARLKEIPNKLEEAKENIKTG